MHSTATWLAERTASIVPRLLPAAWAAASCQYVSSSSCNSGFSCTSGHTHYTATLFITESCGGVVGYYKFGCC